MNENPETSNRVPVAGLAVDACSASGPNAIRPWQESLARMAYEITQLRQARDDALDVCSLREMELRELRKRHPRDAIRYHWLRRFDRLSAVNALLAGTNFTTLDSAVDHLMGAGCELDELRPYGSAETMGLSSPNAQDEPRP